MINCQNVVERKFVFPKINFFLCVTIHENLFVLKHDNLPYICSMTQKFPTRVVPKYIQYLR